MELEEEPLAKRSKLEAVFWTKKKNNYVPKVYENMYLDEKTSDVYFICGAESERIVAHKSVLSKSSPYFDAMFYGPNAKDCDKKYPETSPDAFKDFLKLCYLDEVELNPDHIIEVMKLTHEFQMTESLKLCGELWADNMTVDDVCLSYHWAIHFEMDELKEFCGRKISAHPLLVFETSGFLSCEHIVLNHILQLETLLCDEKLVLQACLNWATNACKRDGLETYEMDSLRPYLKDSLYKIRYSSITTKEFREILDSKDALFTKIKDYEDIIRLTSGSTDLISECFNPNPRSYLMPWNKDRVSECNLWSPENLSRKDVTSGCTTVTKLTSNRTILLGGFFCSPFPRFEYYSNEPNSVKVTIQKKANTGITSTDIYTKSINLSMSQEQYINLKAIRLLFDQSLSIT